MTFYERALLRTALRLLALSAIMFLLSLIR